MNLTSYLRNARSICPVCFCLGPHWPGCPEGLDEEDAEQSGEDEPDYGPEDSADYECDVIA